jgi:hypothetical protein
MVVEWFERVATISASGDLQRINLGCSVAVVAWAGAGVVAVQEK